MSPTSARPTGSMRALPLILGLLLVAGCDTDPIVGGEALVKAVDKVIEKARPLAAHLLEASADDLEYVGGRFGVRGTDQGITIQELATAAFAAHSYPEDMEPSLDAEATYDPVNFNFPHGTHLCAVEVDTETGQVSLSVEAAGPDASGSP